MTVEVKFFASFREIVGQKKVTMEAENVEDILGKIREEYSELGSEIFLEDEDSELEDYVIVMVNGRKIEMLEGTETALDDGDTVAIFPPVAGG